MERAGDNFEADEERARAAWLYFVGGLTQKEIADRLGMTRLRVNRIIGQVRTDGSVMIDIRLPLAGCTALAEELKARWGLKEAVVVPALSDYQAQQRTVGEAAGLLLNRHINGHDMGVGIGWGGTLSYSVRRLMARPHRDSWVVGLMGGVTRGSGTNTFEVATSVARTLGVECHYLTAPIYCSSSVSREALLYNDEIADVLARTEIAEVAMLSCGDLSERSPITPIRIVKDHLDDILRQGAVGEVLGCFLDETGRPVAHFLNETIMALPLGALKLKPVSILASGGTNKTPIIRAILRGRYVNHLVTDEAVAQALLEG